MLKIVNACLKEDIKRIRKIFYKGVEFYENWEFYRLRGIKYNKANRN